MADPITVSMARRLEAVFDSIGPRVHGALLAKITGLTARLADRIRSAEPVRTGKLRSETVERVDDYGERITGRVMIAPNLPQGEYVKAAALEYGARRPTKVTEHTARLDHIYSRMISPMMVIVDRYTRTPNIAPQRFLRDPAAAFSGEFEAEIKATVQKTIDEGGP